MCVWGRQPMVQRRLQLEMAIGGSGGSSSSSGGGAVAAVAVACVAALLRKWCTPCCGRRAHGICDEPQARSCCRELLLCTKRGVRGVSPRLLVSPLSLSHFSD